MADIYKKSDSIGAKFMKSALANNRAATLTKTRMQTTYKAIEAFAKQQRWGSVDPTSLTAKQLKGFVVARIEEGISSRSIQNEMSHIRRALEELGAPPSPRACVPTRNWGCRQRAGSAPAR